LNADITIMDKSYIDSGLIDEMRVIKDIENISAIRIFGKANNKTCSSLFYVDTYLI